MVHIKKNLKKRTCDYNTFSLIVQVHSLHIYLTFIAWLPNDFFSKVLPTSYRKLDTSVFDTAKSYLLRYVYL